MKRSEIEAKAKELFGEDVDPKAFIDYIMAENGRDVQAVKNASTKDLIDATQAKEAAESALKEYQEGGSKFVNQTEFERLRQFEQDTLKARKTEKTTAAIMKLLEENKANPTIAKLLVKGVDFDSVKIKDDGTIENADEIIKPLKEAYPTCFTEVRQKTGAPSNPPAPNLGGGEGEPKSIAAALHNKYDR